MSLNFLEYEFHAHTLKLSNQNILYIGYSVLIGCFLIMSTKIILESLMTLRPEIKPMMSSGLEVS
jgi:hypothetical protein